MPYERANIAAMHGYSPGEQPGDVDVVKLNTNENPFPPTGAVMAALRDITAEQLRRYPPPLATPFRELAAQVHRVAPQNAIATNAGDELLRLAITTFVEPGRPIGTAEPSYSLYPVLADVHGSPTHRVALNDDWSLPADFAKQMNDAGAQLTFIVNPHAPSGALRPVADLARIADELDGVLLIDEAYVDFVDPALGHDAVSLIAAHDNVLILRTLSKGYSLAGLRFGYGIAAAGLIEPMLTKTKDSYNCDTIAQRLAVAALQSRDEAGRSWAAVRAERQRVAEALTAMNLPVAPSQTNFLLAAISARTGTTAADLYRALADRGIYVRYFDQPRLDDKLRITIGTAEQNDKLLAALREIVRLD